MFQGVRVTHHVERTRLEGKSREIHIRVMNDAMLWHSRENRREGTGFVHFEDSNAVCPMTLYEGREWLRTAAYANNCASERHRPQIITAGRAMPALLKVNQRMLVWAELPCFDELLP